LVKVKETAQQAPKLPQQTPFGYSSLASGMTNINALLTGASGVYMLINNLNPSRYYIGSSVNLGRRFSEYKDLANKVKPPVSKSETEISETSADN